MKYSLAAQTSTLMWIVLVTWARSSQGVLLSSHSSESTAITHT